MISGIFVPGFISCNIFKSCTWSNQLNLLTVFTL